MQFVLLIIIALVSSAVSAAAQQNGPLFSTPASRSTTGAPILNMPVKLSRKSDEAWAWLSFLGSSHFCARMGIRNLRQEVE